MTSIASARPLALLAGYNFPMKRAAFLVLALLPYLAYLYVALRAPSGPVDLDTFREIGARLLTHQPIYGENSYYPMPMVMVFSLLALLPRDVVLVLWLGLPVLVALIISNWSPWALLFAPVFSHFAGGQSAVFGLVGVWGYRHYRERPWSGAFLALTLLKPQLGVFPLVWACLDWGKQLIEKEKRATALRQVGAFAITTLMIYAPSFLLDPAWPVKWLASPRPIGERALAGLLPRLLLGIPDYWLILTVFGILFLIFTWDGTFERFLLASALVNPLLHDYDLITLIPVIHTKRQKLATVLLSAPCWWVMLAHYNNDLAWSAFALLAVGIMFANSSTLFKNREESILCR